MTGVVDGVRVVRSARRKKTVSARLVNGELVVYLPAGMDEAEERKWVETLRSQIEARQKKRELNSDKKLERRFEQLNKIYFDGRLSVRSIEFVTNQNSRFGSCTPADRTIRVSHRVAEMPVWVQDYVLIHEMAHLVHPDHSRAFWKVVGRYRYAERARGYLICKGMDDDGK